MIKRITRILILVLAMIQIVGCLSACKFDWLGGDGDTSERASEEESTLAGSEEETTEDDSVEDETSGETSTEEETSGEESSDKESTEEAEFVLTKELLASYSIVTPFQSSEDMHAVAKVLQRSIKDATGLTLEIKNDLLLPGETDGVQWASMEKVRSMVKNGEICRIIGHQFRRQEAALLKRQDAQE